MKLEWLKFFWKEILKNRKMVAARKLQYFNIFRTIDAYTCTFQPFQDQDLAKMGKYKILKQQTWEISWTKSQKPLEYHTLLEGTSAENQSSEPAECTSAQSFSTAPKNLSNSSLVKEGSEWDDTLPSSPETAEDAREPCSPRREADTASKDGESCLKACHNKTPPEHIRHQQSGPFRSDQPYWPGLCSCHPPDTEFTICAVQLPMEWLRDQPQAQESSPNNSQVMQKAWTGADQGNYKVNLSFSFLIPLFKGVQGRRAPPYIVLSHFPPCKH